MSAEVIPVPASRDVAQAWDRHLDKAISEHIRVTNFERTKAGDRWQITCTATSATGNGPYTVVVAGESVTPQFVCCTCPGGKRKVDGEPKPQRCKHAAAMLAALGMI